VIQVAPGNAGVGPGFLLAGDRSYSEREPETGLARKTSQVTCAWMNDQTSARKGFKDGERNTKPLLKSLHQVTTAVFGDRNPNSAS
jgi:hypothetical protein